MKKLRLGLWHELPVLAAKVALVVKNLPTSAEDVRKPGSVPGLRKMPWGRAWQPTPIFLPGESPWTEEPGGLQSIRSQRVGHNQSDRALMHAWLLLVEKRSNGPSFLGNSVQTFLSIDLTSKHCP